ncbi:hypothetical protein BC831DRAFT_86036 [Entophlyctis helioformis]|nr:hypothetical protein BC831DRAFT_86036 [Entophlyctis helioformis]
MADTAKGSPDSTCGRSTSSCVWMALIHASKAAMWPSARAVSASLTAASRNSPNTCRLLSRPASLLPDSTMCTTQGVQCGSKSTPASRMAWNVSKRRFSSSVCTSRIESWKQMRANGCDGPYFAKMWRRPGDGLSCCMTTVSGMGGTGGGSGPAGGFGALPVLILAASFNGAAVERLPRQELD